MNTTDPRRIAEEILKMESSYQKREESLYMAIGETELEYVANRSPELARTYLDLLAEKVNADEMYRVGSLAVSHLEVHGFGSIYLHNELVRVLKDYVGYAPKENS